MASRLLRSLTAVHKAQLCRSPVRDVAGTLWTCASRSATALQLTSHLLAPRLIRLLDTRFAGLAKGVGTAKILGRVHAAEMKMGKAHFTVSITVLENQDMDFLFGLDQLKRHQVSRGAVRCRKTTLLSELHVPDTPVAVTAGLHRSKE